MSFDDQKEEKRRLSDGREEIGSEFERPVPRESRRVGEEFAAHTAYDGPAVGERFAETGDEREVGRAFADPNSADDRKLGNSFEATMSSAKKKHAPLKDRVHVPKTRGPLLWFIAGVVVLFLIVLLVGWLPRHNQNKETRERADQEKNAEPVIQALRVTHAKNSTGLVVPGTTTPLTEAYVYARANGYLKKRLVDIGDHVHKGQLLAIIDAPDLDQQVDQAREQVRQAEAQLAQQETQLALTKVTVDRYRALVAKGVFSRQDGDQREADYQAQRANVASAERNIEAFQANLRRVIALASFERVTSPFDGIITQRNIDVGALISTSGSAGSGSPTPMPTSGTGTQAASSNTTGVSGTEASSATPSTGGAQGGALFAIAQVQRLRILVSVPEGYAGMIEQGQKAVVFFQEMPTQRFYGDVTRTSKSIDQNSRTLLVEVQVDNHDGKLMSGMYAVVTFAAGAGQGPLTISGDAIAIRKDRPMVAVIGDDGTVHMTPVEIGRDYGSETEIVSGLRDGQLIAATFTDDVRDGVKVKTQMDQSAQEKAAPQTSSKPQPPGGSTQYSDPGIVDQDMQGQNAKPQQKGQGKGGAQKKGSGDTGSKP